MGTIRDAINLLSAVRAALPAIAEDAVRDSEAEIVAVQQEQMFEGIGGDGIKIGSYAPITQQYKRAKGQPTDRVTGYDTGGMYSAMDLQVSGGAFSIASTSATYAPFVEKYPYAFGISQEYKPDVVVVVAPKIVAEIKKRTGFK